LFNYLFFKICHYYFLK